MLGTSGAHCRLAGPPPQDLLLIEHNRTNGGVLNAGVHVFSPSYLRRDQGFAHGLETDLKRGRASAR